MNVVAKLIVGVKKPSTTIWSVRIWSADWHIFHLDSLGLLFNSMKISDTKMFDAVEKWNLSQNLDISLDRCSKQQQKSSESTKFFWIQAKKKSPSFRWRSWIWDFVLTLSNIAREWFLRYYILHRNGSLRPHFMFHLHLNVPIILSLIWDFISDIESIPKTFCMHLHYLSMHVCIWITDVSYYSRRCISNKLFLYSYQKWTINQRQNLFRGRFSHFPFSYHFKINTKKPFESLFSLSYCIIMYGCAMHWMKSVDFEG